MIIALATLAAAQDAATGFSVQNYRAPIDSRVTLWTERTSTYSDLTFTGHIIGLYTGNPLLYRDAGGEEDRLVSTVWQTDLSGGAHYRGFRLGASAPVYLASTGDAVTSGGGLGDLALDLKATALRDGDAPLGLALAGRVLLPTATLDAPLANRNTGWELTALADKQFSQIVLAANVGLRGAPSVDLPNINLDDQMFYRAAAAYLFESARPTGVSLDLAGQLNFSDLGPPSAPVELLLGGWAELGKGLVLRGGVGRGFTEGIGSPDLRVLLGLAFAPKLEAEPAAEPPTQLLVLVQTPDGQPVPDVTSALNVDGTPNPGDDSLSMSVDPGTYPFTANAPGYAPLNADVTVPPGADHRVVLTMKPVPLPVTVRLTDLSGNPLTGEWSADQQTWAPIAGEVTTELLQGTYTLYGRAADFQNGQEKLVVKPKGDNVAVVELGKRVAETEGTIDLKEVVRYDTNSATIKRESYPLLDEVAIIMIRHPEIVKIRVEGHTDSMGEASYNQSLSQRRAASVVRYLTEKGVAAERMSSVGYGEEKPVDTNDTAQGREKNRRVVIFIEERAD